MKYRTFCFFSGKYGFYFTKNDGIMIVLLKQPIIRQNACKFDIFGL